MKSITKTNKSNRGCIELITLKPKGEPVNLGQIVENVNPPSNLDVKVAGLFSRGFFVF